MTRRFLAIAAIASLPLLAACSASHHQAVPKGSPSGSAAAENAGQASADCGKLKSSALPLAAYDQLVTREISRIAGGGNATRSQVRQAHRLIAAEVRHACPQFADLIRQDG